jgi:hypothetical protein
MTRKEGSQLEDDGLDATVIEDQVAEARAVPRRLRERCRGQGYAWPFVLTAVLVHGEGGGRFDTLHRSMPVD